MEGDDGFVRRWVCHWITGILFSLIFFFLLQGIEPPFLLRALDRVGSDAVIRGYAPRISIADPRIVVVDLGAGPTTKIVLETLASVKEAHPRAVGLDLFFVKDLQDARLPSGANPVDLLAKNLKLQDAPIATDVRSNQQLEEKLVGGKDIQGAKEIRPASLELRRDEDGVVRSVCPEKSGNDKRPTLAEAMLGLTETRCRPDHDPVIRFAPVGVPRANRDPGVYIVWWETVASQKGILSDSYVLLGSTVRGAGSDQYLTPVGELPGVMIHAQSLWTLMHDEANFWERHRELLAALLDLLTAFLTGAIFSVFLAWIVRSEQRIDSMRQALRQFAEGLFLLAIMAAVLVLTGVAWTWLAVWLLSAGVAIGAMSAVFGAMLETLVHAGKFLVEPLHWLVERAMKHKAVTTVIVVALTILRVRSPVALTDRGER